MPRTLPFIPFIGSASRLLVAGAMVAALVACSGGGAATQSPSSGGDGASGSIEITAQDIAFDTDELRVPAGESFTITFVNDDSVPHNVAIYASRGGEEIFVGEVITAETIEYEVPALEAGEYYFQCDVHPDMNGTVIAE